MTYKIFTLEVDDPIKPLYSPLIIKTVGTNRSINFEEYETDDIEELQLKIEELMQIKGATNFRVISDITYELNVTVPKVCVCIPEEPPIEPEEPEEPPEDGTEEPLP